MSFWSAIPKLPVLNQAAEGRSGIVLVAGRHSSSLSSVSFGSTSCKAHSIRSTALRMPQLLLVGRHVGRVHDDLQRIAHVMIHGSDGLQTLHELAQPVALVAEDEEADDHGAAELVEDTLRASQPVVYRDLVGRNQQREQAQPG